jgi:oxygen-independent coproporphyrinogen-3 oxidase
MSGIYIHIPFCVQACHYCDFHFSTNQKNKSEMVEMICREIALRKEYLTDKNISTIYFGGGTPSLLEAEEFEKILTTIGEYFTIEKAVEITVEANPDDLTEDKLKALKSIGVNRLSIGIQSFDDGQLRYMNRAHNALQAETSVTLAQRIGFDNISIDLIYGIPSPDHRLWRRDLERALSLKIQHISSYCLTIEPSTVFGKRKEKGILKAEDEEYNAQQFELLTSTLEANGFEQYEVSNFCLPGWYSSHNSNYWKSTQYLGIGPGAHSYNSLSRQYNIENNVGYIHSLQKGLIPCSVEMLDVKTRANEYMMTRLRTKWGMDCSVLEREFGIQIDSFKEILDKYQKMDYLIIEKTMIKLTKKGLLFADKITEDLFII